LGGASVGVPVQEKRWRLRHGHAGLKLMEVRSFGTEEFTWADLLRPELAKALVHAFYFPSRFDLPVDAAATESLRLFGQQSSAKTSVNFWDPTDENFSEALGLFGLRNPPVLVLVTGLHREEDSEGGEGKAPDIGSLSDSLYCISFADQDVLADRQRLAAAVNIAHEILVRCDSKEITHYVRGRKRKELLGVIGQRAGAVRDELIKLHPKFGLPGGFSFELG
jgi:hypothetical protein